MDVDKLSDSQIRLAVALKNGYKITRTEKVYHLVSNDNESVDAAKEYFKKEDQLIYWGMSKDYTESIDTAISLFSGEDLVISIGEKVCEVTYIKDLDVHIGCAKTLPIALCKAYLLSLEPSAPITDVDLQRELKHLAHYAIDNGAIVSGDLKIAILNL